MNPRTPPRLPGSAALATELGSTGALRSAFLRADRASFVPSRIWYQPEDTEDDVPVDREQDPDHWTRVVHSDLPLVTQFDDGATEWPEVGHRPSSSNSAPAVVAGMLSLVDIQPGEHVLEVGTGTGWNAALLAELVGEAGRVTTVEVDPVVAAEARQRLHDNGYHRVHTVVADAAAELPGTEHYDRIIVTGGVHLGRLPYFWIERTRPGGVIVAPMRTTMTTGPLVRFTVGEDGTATGHASDDMQVGFMDLRTQRNPTLASAPTPRWDDPEADLNETDLSPWLPLFADAHRWPIALALPGCRYDLWERTDTRPHGVAWLRDLVTDSWASVVPGAGDRFDVRQHGPRRLWDAAETAYRWWCDRGQPPLSAWRWQVTREQQTCTLP